MPPRYKWAAPQSGTTHLIPPVSRPAARVEVFLGEVNSPKNSFNDFLAARPTVKGDYHDDF